MHVVGLARQYFYMCLYIMAGVRADDYLRAIRPLKHTLVDLLVSPLTFVLTGNKLSRALLTICFLELKPSYVAGISAKKLRRTFESKEVYQYLTSQYNSLVVSERLAHTSVGLPKFERPLHVK